MNYYRESFRGLTTNEWESATGTAHTSENEYQENDLKMTYLLLLETNFPVFESSFVCLVRSLFVVRLKSKNKDVFLRFGANFLFESKNCLFFNIYLFINFWFLVKCLWYQISRNNDCENRYLHEFYFEYSITIQASSVFQFSSTRLAEKLPEYLQPTRCPGAQFPLVFFSLPFLLYFFLVCHSYPPY